MVIIFDWSISCLRTTAAFYLYDAYEKYRIQSFNSQIVHCFKMERWLLSLARIWLRASSLGNAHLFFGIWRLVTLRKSTVSSFRLFHVFDIKKPPHPYAATFLSVFLNKSYPLNICFFLCYLLPATGRRNRFCTCKRCPAVISPE